MSIRHICIVDDDKDDIFLMSTSLKRLESKTAMRFRVSAFYNGQDAFDYFSTIENHNAYLPDCISLDINMPAIDGMELLRRLRAMSHLASVPIYIVSTTANITTLETHERAIRERDGEVVADIPDTVVTADPTLMVQILQNLSGNAINCTPSNRSLKLSITTAATHRGLDYAIEDNGIGIDPAVRARIFQPFSRRQPGGCVKGSGTGPAIVDKPIRQLGRKIAVEAAQPPGTRLRRIPAHQLVGEGELVE